MNINLNNIKSVNIDGLKKEQKDYVEYTTNQVYASSEQARASLVNQEYYKELSELLVNAYGLFNKNYKVLSVIFDKNNAKYFIKFHQKDNKQVLLVEVNSDWKTRKNIEFVGIFETEATVSVREKREDKWA